mmetsp:Transcript_6690/g.18788  ORF Transcript_6690/g.18788 Transcript_6690/m.18788 type:complete len:256 (+) Transcript_6690:804-1571(+)
MSVPAAAVVAVEASVAAAEAVGSDSNPRRSHPSTAVWIEASRSQLGLGERRPKKTTTGRRRRRRSAPTLKHHSSRTWRRTSSNRFPSRLARVLREPRAPQLPKREPIASYGPRPRGYWAAAPAHAPIPRPAVATSPPTLYWRTMSCSNATGSRSRTGSPRRPHTRHAPSPTPAPRRRGRPQSSYSSVACRRTSGERAPSCPVPNAPWPRPWRLLKRQLYQHGRAAGLLGLDRRHLRRPSTIAHIERPSHHQRQFL